MAKCNQSSTSEHLKFHQSLLNSKLVNGTNAIKCGRTNNSTYMFCDQMKTLDHVIGGCETELLESRCNCRHNSIPLNVYKTTNHKGLFFFFFNCYLAVPRPTLRHSQGGSLTNPMLITAYVHI